MRRVRKLIAISTLALILLFVLIGGSSFVATGRPQRLPQYASLVSPHLSFEQLATPGFDQEGWACIADSTWSMRYFQADGASTGYLYVGTENPFTRLEVWLHRDR